MSISLQCTCGKTLTVDDKYRGKKAKCPACGNVLLVEEPVETAVQAETPMKRPAAADEPETRTPVKRPEAGTRSKMPMLALGVAPRSCCSGA